MFVKGKSGNPGGRPKVSDEFKAKARKIVDDLVLQKWEQEIRSEGEHWVKCTELVTAYALGKPAQAVEVSGDLKNTHEVGDSITNLITAIRKSRGGK